MSYNRSALKSCSQTALSFYPAKKPFCKVCHDAGKPESDYTSHHVRSLPDKQGNTKVICPTLLNTECRYCYGLGHTAKFCPAIAAKKKTEYREKSAPIPIQKPKEDLRRGGFHALMDLDDEVEHVVKANPVVEEFPALGAPSKRVEMSGYAAAAATAKPIIAAKPALPSGFQVLQKGAVYEKTEKPTFVRTSWADLSDDEDEDDEQLESAWD